MEQFFLLTIIAEEVLARDIEQEIVSLGAKGYTVSAVSGKGVRNVRDNPWEGENVKIETVVLEQHCNDILAHLQKKYLERYAMIAFYHPVSVIRRNHFV